MKFEELSLSGAYLIHFDPFQDHRGSFSRIFCQEAFKREGLEHHFSQVNISFNKSKNTLRGLHFQISPYEEVKLISCTKGSVFDVIVDLRKDSKTYGKWQSVELSQKCSQALYVPKNFAHGFKTREDESELLYLISSPYIQNAAAGIYWRDPTLKIE